MSKKVGVMLPAYRKILVIKQERAQKRNSTEKADLVAGDGQGEFLRRICIHLNPCYPWGKGSEKKFPEAATLKPCLTKYQ